MRYALLLSIGLLLPLSASAVPQVSAIPCNTALQQRGICVSGQVVELRVWEGIEWAAHLQEEVAPILNYQSTVPCESARRVDVEMGNILIAAGPGDGLCTIENVGDTIANPQSLSDAWEKWTLIESRREDVRKRREKAAEDARNSIPDIELQTDGQVRP
jgi:hypothetical protein